MVRKPRVTQPNQQSGPYRFPVVVRDVNPGVWATALKLAKGDTSLLRVVSWGRVIVTKPPSKKEKKNARMV